MVGRWWAGGDGEWIKPRAAEGGRWRDVEGDKAVRRER